MIPTQPALSPLNKILFVYTPLWVYISYKIELFNETEMEYISNKCPDIYHIQMLAVMLKRRPRQK